MKSLTICSPYHVEQMRGNTIFINQIRGTAKDVFSRVGGDVIIPKSSHRLIDEYAMLI